jgi:hypothetical protein
MAGLYRRRSLAALGAAPAKNPELFYVARDGALMAVQVDPHGSVWRRPLVKVVEGPHHHRRAVFRGPTMCPPMASAS